MFWVTRFLWCVEICQGTPDISAACKESNLFHYSCLARWVLHTLTIIVNLTFFNPFTKYEKDSHIYTIYKRFFAQKKLLTCSGWLVNDLRQDIELNYSGPWVLSKHEVNKLLRWVVHVNKIKNSNSGNHSFAWRKNLIVLAAAWIMCECSLLFSNDCRDVKKNL